MADAPAVSEAFYHAVRAIVHLLNVKKLPDGLSTVETDNWKLTINASMKPLPMADGKQDLGPFEVFVEGKKYLVFGVLAPSGGMIGGMREDKLLEELIELAGGPEK